MGERREADEGKRVINETKTKIRDDDTKEMTFPERLILLLCSKVTT
jgi:hypothetical protein